MQVLEIAFGYPTVFFTTVLLISASYWLLSMLLGFDGGGGDIDLDFGGDGLDTGSGEGSSGDSGSGEGGSNVGVFAGILQAFDLHLMPVALVLTITSLTGFLVSSLGTLALGVDGSTSVLVGLVVVLVSLLAGMYIAGKFAVLLAPFFVPEPHIRRSDLVGRLCTIRTGSVSATFGQAEAVDSASSTHIIQVRCLISNDLSEGSPALIVSVDDDGDYVISPDTSGLL